MNFGSGECIESSACVEAVLKHIANVWRFYSQEVCTCMEPVLYLAKNRNPWHCFISAFSMSFCKKTSACVSQVDHMYMGHIQIALRAGQWVK